MISKFLKIIVLAIITCLAAVELSYAQTSDLCVQKGKSIMDIYYGLPNFYPTIIKKDYDNNFDLTRGLDPDYKVANFNPIGVRYEYMLTDMHGIGFNLYYAKSKIEWADATYDYKSEIARYRLAFMYNYHFYVSKRFDIYLNTHLGYSYVDYKFIHVSKIDSIPPIHPKPDIQFDYPFTLRVGLGARYFINDWFGLHAELGIGGVFFQGGLTFGFNKKSTKP